MASENARPWLRSTSLAWSLVVWGAVAACSSSTTPAGTGSRDGGGGGSGGTDAGTKHPAGSGGGGGGGPAGPIVCQASSLALAPDVCTDADWTHAVHSYHRLCATDLGAYQATCGDFDTIIVAEASKKTWCFYAHANGNLTASEVVEPSDTTCLTFDIDVKVPDTTTCVAKSAICSDAGP